MNILTAPQVATRLNVSVARVYDLSRRKLLPCFKLGRQYRFLEEALDEFIRSGGQPLPGGWKKEA